MSEDYVPPKFEADAFNCPHCDAYASQKWDSIKWSSGFRSNPYDAKLSYCRNCREYGVWVNQKLLYPGESPAPLPNEDMPPEVKEDYNEARKVVSESPKAAAAILRLAMEKLTQELTGNEDQSLYANIGELLEEGRIDERIQKALDSVRVTGNDYVHAGEIYSYDDAETTLRLFRLVNTIVELTISNEKLIEESFGEIPENKLEGIQQRDEN
ncbi:DUF4145 domain-containing protein [Halomicrococcus sp. SG-WS-1]|uniref:DUF4145 domain-containing protein n=1 Tax=Halomicrococcus sp. SG-WS-1 TaxID=3439057 RepID=UPI003F792F97